MTSMEGRAHFLYWTVLGHHRQCTNCLQDWFLVTSHSLQQTVLASDWGERDTTNWLLKGVCALSSINQITLITTMTGTKCTNTSMLICCYYLQGTFPVVETTICPVSTTTRWWLGVYRHTQNNSYREVTFNNYHTHVRQLDESIPFC
jgi:hypothetical protein